VPQTDLDERAARSRPARPDRCLRARTAGRANAAVSEAMSQANEASFSFRQEALNERSQVQQKIAINEQSLRGAGGQLGRELRSPVDGVVNDLQITTIGGFVQPGEKVMEVVPMGDKLLVETRVKPRHLHQGWRQGAGQGDTSFSTYGGLDGKVVRFRPAASMTRSSAKPISSSSSRPKACWRGVACQSAP
jgi:adhesin transport system membrane fusion protein